MPGIEVVVLGAVVDFVKSVSSSAASERVKLEGSPRRAAQLAWTACEQLDALARRTDAFVAALRALRTVPGLTEPWFRSPEDHRASGLALEHLGHAIGRANDALQDLSETMCDLSGPLQVQAPDLRE